jgi:hypothetical protein
MMETKHCSSKKEENEERLASTCYSIPVEQKVTTATCTLRTKVKWISSEQ